MGSGAGRFACGVVLLSTIAVVVSSSGAASAPIAASVPSTCGGVGASSYTVSPVQVPAVDISPRGRIITVSTASDASDGNTSSVAALQANPGPDGAISLREAIQATNSDPGAATIVFAASLRGATIAVGTLPELHGGNVLVDGDIDGDGKPDVTLAPSSAAGADPTALEVSSAGNTIYALALNGWARGIDFKPSTPGATYAANAVRGVVMTSIGEHGITFTTWANGTHWVGTTIVGNTIEVDHTRDPQSFFGGVNLSVLSNDSSLEQTTIANNTIRLSRGGIPNPITVSQGGAGISVAAGGNGGSRTQDIGTLIAGNDIELTNGAGGDGDFGVFVYTGGAGGNNNTSDGLRIVSNHITLPAPGAGLGIQIMASEEIKGTYAEGNVMKNVSVLGNTIEGQIGRGIDIGKATGKGNQLQNVTVAGNSVIGGPGYGFHFDAVLIVAGSMTGPQPVGENDATGVVVKQNTLRLVGAAADVPNGEPAALKVIAGQGGATANRANDVSVAQNVIDGGGGLGILLQGAWNASGNTLSGATVSCNDVTGDASRGVRGAIVLMGGRGDDNGGDAHGNAVQDVKINDNAITSPSAGITLVGGIGSQAQGNIVSSVTLSGNVIKAPTPESGAANLSGAMGNTVPPGLAPMPTPTTTPTPSPSPSSARTCTVPSVRGLPLATAERQIVAAHCAVGTIKRQKAKKTLQGVVLKQAPNPGTPEAAGFKVNLLVGIR